MNTTSTPRIALALITRHLEDPDQVLRFLDNADRFGHPVDRVIAAYSHSVKRSVVETIGRRVRMDVLKAFGDEGLRDRLQSGGLTQLDVDGLLGVPSWGSHREAPYSAYRNAVLLHALIEGLDAVIFFDTDVDPKLLTGIDDGRPSFHDVDFVGAHMASLSDEGVVATTSEYSGYYIIPPMRFDGLEPLLAGLRKEHALGYLKTSSRHHCLNLASLGPRQPRPTNKPLGGNLGLGLQHPECLSLFYSTTYVFRDRCIMGRGEDTLLGRAISRSSRRIVDIDLPVFHDTYPGFPKVPDLGREVIRTRFYLACLGWIGRNPFLTWFLARTGGLETSFETAIQRQRKGLRVGGRKAAQALGDPRFAGLSHAFEASLSDLPVAIRRYERLMAGWDALLRTFYPGRRLESAFPLAIRESSWGTGHQAVAKAGPDEGPFARSSPVV